jgi:hypothetical protein
MYQAPLQVLSFLNQCYSSIHIGFNEYLSTIPNSLVKGYKIYSKHIDVPRRYCKIYRVKAITDLPQEFL